MRSVRESPEPSYRDIKVSIRFPNGGVGEIIVTSKFYDDVKFNRGGHEAYEVIRTIEAKWPNEDDIPREIRDIYYEFKTYSKNIYSRGSSLEDIRMAYSSASASLTRLPSSNSLFAIQNSDVIGILNSISEGFQRKVPYSLDSYATPSRSLIQNDISNSSKEKSPDKGSVSRTSTSVTGEGLLHCERVLFRRAYPSGIADFRGGNSDFSVLDASVRVRNVLGDGLSMVPQTGFEPATRCLEGSCSVQLSYWGKRLAIVAIEREKGNEKPKRIKMR